jgi:hypothetical protein
MTPEGWARSPPSHIIERTPVDAKQLSRFSNGQEVWDGRRWRSLMVSNKSDGIHNDPIFLGSSFQFSSAEHRVEVAERYTAGNATPVPAELSL